MQIFLYFEVVVFCGCGLCCYVGGCLDMVEVVFMVGFVLVLGLIVLLGIDFFVYWNEFVCNICEIIGLLDVFQCIGFDRCVGDYFQ